MGYGTWDMGSLTLNSQPQHHLVAQQAGIDPHVPFLDLQFYKQIAFLERGKERR